jgi:hypothetical protein
MQPHQWQLNDHKQKEAQQLHASQMSACREVIREVLE